MSELRDYITSRRDQLQRQLDEIQATAAPIVAELRDLKRAELALASGGKSGPRKQTAAGSEPHADSIQGRILRVLGEHPEGMTANEIVESLSADFGTPVERTSVAPQLSRLLGAGRLAREGGVYALASQEGSGC